jgi:hypothetical protein
MCPWYWKYLGEPDYCGNDLRDNVCDDCWNREIPEETDKEKPVTTKKTKAQLLDEIAELKKQVSELEKYDTYRKCGDELKAIQTEFMNAGFSNEQAFILLQTMLQNSIMAGAVDAVKAVTRRK